MPNGCLELSLVAEHAHATWCDGKRRRLENLLNEVVARFYVLAAQTKKWRADAELSRQRYAEAERRRRDEEKRAAMEAERAKQLLESVSRWRLARDIREYVTAMRTAGSQVGVTTSANFDESLMWAIGYAARIDPSTPVRTGRASPSEGDADDATEARNE